MRIRAFVLSLVIIVPCAFALFKGAEIMGFSRLSARADDFSASRKPNQEPDGTEFAAMERGLAGWSDIAGVRYEAIARAVALKSVSGPPVEFEGVKPDVVTLLSSRPMAGNFWMFLADGELLSGEPIERVLSIFQMAVMTAPREGVNMSRRVDFGIRIWEFLAPDLRERVAYDFNAVRPLLNAREWQRLRAIVATKQDDVRDDLRAHLAQRARIGTSWFSLIGL